MVYHSPQETAWGVTMRIKVERTLIPAALRILRWGLWRQVVALETGKQCPDVYRGPLLPSSFGLV